MMKTILKPVVRGGEKFKFSHISLDYGSFLGTIKWALEMVYNVALWRYDLINVRSDDIFLEN